MFLGLSDPHPDPLVISTDPDLDLSLFSHISVKRTEITVVKKNLTQKFSCCHGSGTL
jgi:hypothetical protein